jgi:hypothetical protein
MTFVGTSCSKQFRQFSPHNHHVRLCSIRWGYPCCFDHRKHARGGSASVLSGLSWFRSRVNLARIGRRRGIRYDCVEVTYTM